MGGRSREEEQRVLAELSAAVAEQVEGLQHLMQVLLKLDLALARGRYGQWLGAVPPRLESAVDAPFELRTLRHPLLVWQERNEQGLSMIDKAREMLSKAAESPASPTVALAPSPGRPTSVRA